MKRSLFTQHNAQFLLRGIGVVSATAVAISVHSKRKETQLDSETKPTVYDLAIVGGGIVGSSVALFSKKLSPNSSILLLESESIASGASAHSAGTLWVPQILSETPTIHSPTWDEVLGSQTIEVYRLVEAAKYDCQLVESGGLIVAGSQKEAAYVKLMFQDLQSRGFREKQNDTDDDLGIEWLSSETKLLKAEPKLHVASKGGQVVSALHLPACAHIHSLEATLSLAQYAQDLGVEIQENSQVQKLEYSPELKLWKLTLKNGKQVPARKVCLANGATASLLFPRVKIVPVKGQIIESSTPQEPGYLKKIILSFHAHADFVSGVANSQDERTPPECTHNSKGQQLTRHLYGRQRKDGYVIMGGVRIPYPNFAKIPLDYSVNTQLMKQVVDHSKEIINYEREIFSEEMSESSWACFMPFSVDGKPLLGLYRGEYDNSLFLAVGFGPEGMTFGPGAGYILAVQIFKENLLRNIPFAELVLKSLSPAGRLRD